MVQWCTPGWIRGRKWRIETAGNRNSIRVNQWSDDIGCWFLFFSGDTTMRQTGLPILYNFTNIQNCSQMTCRCSFSELTYDNSDRRNEKEGFETRKENIIYVGIDLHKETHTCSGKQKLLKRDSQKILCTAS